MMSRTAYVRFQLLGPLDYNEWQIKWGEVVHCHNIPEQQELGILKESIPEMAQKKLYKVIDLKTAWEKLKNLLETTR